MTVQVKAGLALESLALNNQATQMAIIQLDAVSYMIRLLEVYDDELWMKSKFYHKNLFKRVFVLEKKFY